MRWAGWTRSDYLYGLRTGDEHTVPLGRGVRLILGLEAIGSADERGMRTVMCTLNGQLRPIRVRDTSIKVDIKAAEKADPTTPGHVAAPFAGVVSVAVAEGDHVEAGQTVATIEAMKMEAAITTAVAGAVQRLALGSVQQVEGGDLVSGGLTPAYRGLRSIARADRQSRADRWWRSSRQLAQKPTRSGTGRPMRAATSDHGTNPSSQVTRLPTSSRCSSVLISWMAAR